MLAEILEDPEVKAEFNAQPEHDRIAKIAHASWVASAHRYQIPPPLEVDYTVWMMLAGRGAGKTRSAAEALWWWCWINPGSRGLVLAPTSNDVKFTCFEGESGLLSVIPPELIVNYNKSDMIIEMKTKKIDEIRNTPIPGLYELRFGTEIRYSDAKGEFLQVGLPPGTYKITASKDKLTRTVNNVPIRTAANDRPINLQLSADGGLTDEERKAAAATAQAAQEAVAAMNAGRDDEAIAKFNDILAKVPNCADCLYNLGVAFGHKQQWAQAEESFKKLLTLRPDNADAYNGLANVYNAQKRFDEAIAASKKASELAGPAASGGSAEALARVTHLGIGAHQDDLEFMAFHGILQCFHSETDWFGGVTCTNGSGSARKEFFYWTDDGGLAGLRYDKWKLAFMEQRAHGFDVWHFVWIARLCTNSLPCSMPSSMKKQWPTLS